MSYHHQFTGRTEGIRPTAPLRWRGLDGLIAAFWEAEGDAGARGYYLSANPRISLFFDDVASIRVTDREETPPWAGRPMARAIFVPAGRPLWTSFARSLQFSHLDLHMDAGKALKTLAPSLGRAAAAEALRRPAEAAPGAMAALEPLGRLLVAEIETPARHDLYAESLAAALLAGVLDLGSGRAARAEGRLTRAQLRKVAARFEAGGGRRLSVAELAEAVGLSESWFSHVFKATTGMTPLQWQARRRIGLAKTLLDEGVLDISDIAQRLGYSDQAHLTRAFRQVEGETPAAWRRSRRGAGTALPPPSPG
ncbi:MAG: AraC family transcriptional regulator [Pseudomonadota bacterium]|nr:AraC family transcriptional regulator [Pseudomonadota bacterium]